ncbi:putative phospholipase B-like 1 [Lycorma delicatula]|uniref:putative phospholipase B-like 1 n=1 Tax=Lycorma delicatula TaxID=130591 RepID=UPI003F517E54
MRSSEDLLEMVLDQNGTNGDAQFVLEQVRVMVANRLSLSGKSWSHTFSQRNSGTFNNQWMIVDYNRFEPGKPLKNGLFWVLEQLPGYIAAQDETPVLTKQKYWASYNIPFNIRTFRLSGQTEQIRKYGKWFSYGNNPRGQIFKREQSKVTNMNNFMDLMRYNDYKRDPLSKCNCKPGYSASNAIAARHDLNPANGTFELHYLSHRAGGAIDAKIVNSTLFKKQQFVAVSGPTTGTDLPPFKWSTSKLEPRYRHLGHPDLWQFKPILTEWSLN